MSHELSSGQFGTDSDRQDNSAARPISRRMNSIHHTEDDRTVTLFTVEPNNKPIRSRVHGGAARVYSALM